MPVIREILRLALDLKLSANQVHRMTGASRHTVQQYLKRAAELGLTWPLSPDMDDAALENVFYSPKHPPEPKFSEPGWERVHAELKRKGVTLRLLWKEYRVEAAEGFSYSQFCRRYEEWFGKRDLVMLQHHKGGEKLFVDYAGHTVPVIDRDTGEVRMAQIFVAVFGASNYCYSEASWSQALRCWIGAHVRALEFFGGAPEFLVPDNLKSAVLKARRWDPLLNRTYQRLAEHYKCGILPARPYRARDKAKVEKGVQVVENWILAALRDFQFFSLEQLNATIASLLPKLNDEPFQKLSGSRRTWFERVDKPALQKLPRESFEHEEWTLSIKVPKSYHLLVDGHNYSVPHRLVGEYVDIRLTDHTVEILYDGTRVASHVRSWAEGEKTTLHEHMPQAHAEYAGASAERFLEEAGRIGPSTTQVITAILASKPYPQLSFDQCYALLRRFKSQYGAKPLENSCRYALLVGSPTYRLIKQVLELGVDKLPTQLSLTSPLPSHVNLRGPDHFK